MIVRRNQFVCALALFLLATESYANTIIQGVMTRTDLANYCTDGVSSELMDFRDSSGPFYASRDLTIAGLYDNWRGVTLDMEPDRVITLNGHIYGGAANFKCVGGIYDFQDTYGFNTASWNENVNKSGLILDGAVFTNMPNVVLQNNNQGGGKWTMKNQARIHDSGVFRMVAYNAGCRGISFDMTSGAKVFCSNLETDCGRSIASRADLPRILRLSGEGTTFSSRGSSENMIGRACSQAEVLVSDQAELTLVGTTYIGLESYSYCNALRLSSSATATLGNLWLGCNGGGSNVVEVVDDSVLTVGSCYLNGGATSTRGNVFIVSNATVNAGSLWAPASKGADTTLRISGNHPQIRINPGKIAYDTAFEMNNGVRMVFDIPQTGYLGDMIPITVDGTYDNAGKDSERPLGTFTSDPTKLSIEISGVVEYQDWLKKKTALDKKRVVLLHVAGSISGYDGAISAANQTLPEKCRLYTTNGADVGLSGGRALVLEVKVPRGLLVVFR